MGEKSTAPSAPKKLTCTVVTNYGRHRVGDIVTVEEREYLRLREVVRDEDEKPTGEYRYPVLVTDADAAVIAKREEAARQAKMRKQQEESALGSGWSDLERQSLDIVKDIWRKDAEHQRTQIMAGGAMAGGAGRDPQG